jgi:hypothetical protein
MNGFGIVQPRPRRHEGMGQTKPAVFPGPRRPGAASRQRARTAKNPHELKGRTDLSAIPGLHT